MSINYKIGSIIYHARMQCGMKQAQVAEAVQISERWFQKIEKGTGMPSTTVMLRLMLVLNISPQDFQDALDLAEQNRVIDI